MFRRQWTAGAHDAVDRAEFAERRKDAHGDGQRHRDPADEGRCGGRSLHELNRLVEDWRVRGRDAAKGARTYQLLQILQPAREVQA